jgi:TIGR03009 family protein
MHMRRSQSLNNVLKFVACFVAGWIAMDLASAQQPQSARGFATQPIPQQGAAQAIPQQGAAQVYATTPAPEGSATNPAAGAGLAVAPQAPFPPLTPEYQQFLDQVLAKWEAETAKVEVYRCNFRRYQYDPSLHQDGAATIAMGSVRYMKPDKGLFRVDQLYTNNGRDANGQPKFEVNPNNQFGEYWICDGEYVHIMERQEKVCKKIQLPPEMRGNAIYLSPLPFLFGVKAQEIKSRYWIRPLPPPAGRESEIWLEAFPQRADDAGNYQRVQVVIDRTDWMPKGLIVFLPNWREDAPHRELYEFEKREINWSLKDRLNKLNPIAEEFIPKDPPAGWKIIVEPYQASQSGQPAAQQAPGQPVQGEPRVASPASDRVRG